MYDFFLKGMVKLEKWMIVFFLRNWVFVKCFFSDIILISLVVSVRGLFMVVVREMEIIFLYSRNVRKDVSN